MSRRRLGEILLEHGWITRAELGRALKAQQLVGGRLGTCLLEADAISEDLLVHALSEQLGTGEVSIEDLRHVDPDTLALIPKRLAVRCRAVPVHATVGRLDVATSEPGNLDCLDEIAFATSRRVRVLVAPEARVVAALGRYYGEPAPGRFAGLVERLDRQRTPWAEPDGTATGETSAALDELFPPRSDPPAAGTIAAAAPGPTPAATTPVAPPTAKARPPRATAVSLSDAERATLFGAAAAAELAGLPDAAEAGGAKASAGPVAPREPSTLALASAQLDEATERDEIGRILVSFLRQFFDRVALLAVRSDGVHGWMGAGDGLDRERLVDLAIGFDKPSVFLNLRQGANLHLGTLPPMPAHRPLLAALGGDPPGPCLFLPVRLGQRLAAVIYGDREGAPVGGVDLEALRRLADRASAALERCISLKRQAHSGPAAS